MCGQILFLLTFVFIGTLSLVLISLVCPLAENVNVLSINVRVVTVLNEKDFFFFFLLYLNIFLANEKDVRAEPGSWQFVLDLSCA